MVQSPWGAIAAHYHIKGRSTPSQRADGRNKFLVGYECTVYSEAPPPGHLTVYAYHPEQRHDYGDIFFPTGVVQPNTSVPGNFGVGVSRGCGSGKISPPDFFG